MEKILAYINKEDFVNDDRYNEYLGLVSSRKEKFSNNEIEIADIIYYYFGITSSLVNEEYEKLKILNSNLHEVNKLYYIIEYLVVKKIKLEKTTIKYSPLLYQMF